MPVFAVNGAIDLSMILLGSGLLGIVHSVSVVLCLAGVDVALLVLDLLLSLLLPATGRDGQGRDDDRAISHETSRASCAYLSSSCAKTIFGHSRDPARGSSIHPSLRP